MKGISIDYTIVHVDNSQGGSGKVVNENKIISIPQGMSFQDAYDLAERRIETNTFSSYCKENPQIVSMKMVTLDD